MLLQTPTNDSIQGGREIAVCDGKLGRVIVQNRTHRVGHRFACERSFAGKHFVENCAEREDVGTMIDERALAAHLFGRHVSNRTHHSARICLDAHRRRVRVDLGFRLRKLRQTKIKNLYTAIIGEEKIFRFQIAMSDSLRMRRRKAMRDLQRVIERFAHAETFRTEPVSHCLALQKLPNDEQRAVVRPNIQHREDVGMIEPCQRLRFLPEAIDSIRVS